ncbi:hypothetical protein Ddc_10409 [Ditylenchus destructor]|nr:hypothetical protein Ddc_10409 [Ditylenchus destructor]
MPCFLADDNTTQPFDICDVADTIDTGITPYLLHFMFIPAIMVVLLTIADRHAEDAKWFMFNTAVINIISGIAYEFFLFNLTTIGGMRREVVADSEASQYNLGTALAFGLS